MIDKLPIINKIINKVINRTIKIIPKMIQNMYKMLTMIRMLNNTFLINKCFLKENQIMDNITIKTKN